MDEKPGNIISRVGLRRALVGALVAVVGATALIGGGMAALTPSQAAATTAQRAAVVAALRAQAPAPTPTMAPMPGMGSGPAPTKLITMTEGALQMQVLPLSGKAPTWDEVSRVYHMLDRARAATAKYQDVNVAMRDGYYTAPAFYVGSQGYHFVNPRLIPNAMRPFDVTRPPVLVYNKVDGKMVLSGLMYYMPRRTTPAQLAAIFPNSMASWHSHINICISADQSKVLPIHARAACEAQGGDFIPTIGWMVHAWIWHSGATGLFDMDKDM